MTQQPTNPYGESTPQQGWAPPAPNAWGRPFADPHAAHPGGPPPGRHGYSPPPKPGVVPLRPLGLGDMLDGAFRSVRRNAGATLGPSVLLQLLCGVFIAALGAPLFSVMMAPEALAGAAPDDAALVGPLILFVVGILAAGILSGAFLVFIQGMVTVPVLRATLNLRTPLGRALALARPALGRLVVLGLLWAAAGLVATALFVGVVVLAVAVGDAAIGIPIVVLVLLGLLATGIWITVRLSLSAHALVIENLGVFASMGRSWNLVRSSWWRCLGILLLTGLIVSIATSLITTPVSFATGLTGGIVSPEDPGALSALVGNLTVVMTLLGAVAAGLGFAYQCAVSSLLYTDLRIRGEGFDLALLDEFESGTDHGLPGGGAAAAGPGAR